MENAQGLALAGAPTGVQETLERMAMIEVQIAWLEMEYDALAATLPSEEP